MWRRWSGGLTLDIEASGAALSLLRVVVGTRRWGVGRGYLVSNASREGKRARSKGRVAGWQ